MGDVLHAERCGSITPPAPSILDNSKGVRGGCSGGGGSVVEIQVCLFDSTRRICMHADSGSCTCTMALEDSPSLGSVCVYLKCVCVCVCGAGGQVG